MEQKVQTEAQTEAQTDKVQKGKEQKGTACNQVQVLKINEEIL